MENYHVEGKNQENNYPEHNYNMLGNPSNVFRNPAERMFSSKMEDSRKTKEKIKTTEESPDDISGYGKNKRRITVDQFQVPYYSSFVPHDYVTNGYFKLQDMMCNLLKCQSAPDIKHCIQHPPKLEYQNALTLLEKQYGDPFIIMSSYRKEIKLWPEIRAGDASGYRNYYNFLLKCHSICSTCKESTLDFLEVLCVLISKLPGYVRERWNRKVLSIRRTHERDPKLFDLPIFVEEESMPVNDPLFSKEGIKFFAETGSGGRRSETRPGSRREDFKKGKHSVNSYATGMLEKENTKEASCHFCEGAHKLEECEEKKRAEERSKLIGKKKLYYGCLEPMTKEHNAKKL